MAKRHGKYSTMLYLSREILTRMINGVPVVMIDKSHSMKSTSIMPFNDEVNEMEAIKEQMDTHMAFQEGVVYVKGKGFVHKKDLEK